MSAARFSQINELMFQLNDQLITSSLSHQEDGWINLYFSNEVKKTEVEAILAQVQVIVNATEIGRFTHINRAKIQEIDNTGCYTFMLTSQQLVLVLENAGNFIVRTPEIETALQQAEYKSSGARNNQGQGRRSNNTERADIIIVQFIQDQELVVSDEEFKHVQASESSETNLNNTRRVFSGTFFKLGCCDKDKNGNIKSANVVNSLGVDIPVNSVTSVPVVKAFSGQSYKY